MKRIVLNFGVELEVIEGKDCDSYYLRNNLVRKQIKLGEVKNGDNDR